MFGLVQEVLRHIREENAYTDERVEHLKGLRETLYEVREVHPRSVIPHVSMTEFPLDRENWTNKIREERFTL